MQQYLEALQQVYQYGDRIEGRNGFTKEVFGLTMRYDDVDEMFPIITTKKMAFRNIIAELLCFVRGYDTLSDFRRMGCTVWNGNANSDYWKANPNYKPGWLGRIYGVQWRDWKSSNTESDGVHSSVDQLLEVVQNIKTNPHSRRHVVTAWNPGELDEMCLPPCHMFFQVNINSNGRLNLMMYQRSCDMFLGVPFNITSYAALMLILAHQTGYKAGTFTHVLGSAHIYEEHIPAVEQQLYRMPHMPPKLIIDREEGCTLEDYEVMDFKWEREYNCESAIKAEMIV